MTRSRSMLLLALLVGAGLLALPGPTGAVADPAQTEAVSSLREGNRLYREGRLEEARESYLSGYSPAEVNPVLAYNLATTSHHLGRLPEAILWYRRAEIANPGDPWMRDNLVRARASLRLQPYPPPDLATWVSRHATPLSYAGAALAWIGLLLFIARPRRSTRLAMTLFAAGALLYGATVALAQSSPRAAVVLEECTADHADLPAGSEVWITGETDGGYRVVAGEVTLECSRGTVEPVVEVG